MRHLLQKILAKDQDTLIALFTTSSLDSFCAGYLEAVNDYIVMIRAVAPDGQPDGYIVKRIADLSLVEQDSRSLRKIRFMERQAGNYRQSLPGELDATNLIRSILAIAQQHDLVVSIGLEGCDSFVSGLVSSIEDTTASFLQLDERWGDVDGTAHLSLDTIDHLEVLTQDCEKIGLLHKEWDDSRKE